ncbi:polysaccharide deacetylase family protein [Terracidiphilus gabretensis]|uniref:polysaccharide deacetylase family protein n=1 Tax=Terracidiphilus gabretensis TaxID=1577687 RepID=UPI0009E97655|nr:polysaccharide deacetylase family protein [Terracidiphilus gabretensis]
MRVRILSEIVFAGIVLGWAAGALAQGPQIAFTWDDLPAHSALPANTTRVEIGKKILAAMKAGGLPPAYGFVNGVQLEHEPLSEPMLRDWRAAGFPLGNHAYTHMNLNQRSLEDWEADVLKNEPVLQKYAAGSDWHWMRYPYLAEGNTAEKSAGARKFLLAHGYKVADVTMSFGDYMYNEPYARCVAKNDAAGIAKLEESYLKVADAEVDHSRAVAKAVWGNDIPYVLLMHVGAMDAEMLPKLIELYKKRGFTFVTLQDAEKDPAYAADVDLSLPAPAWVRNAPVPPQPKPDFDVNAVCK